MAKKQHAVGPRINSLDDAVFVDSAVNAVEPMPEDEQLITDLRGMLAEADEGVNADRRLTLLGIAAHGYHTIADGIKANQRRGNYLMALVAQDVKNRELWNYEGSGDQLTFWRTAGWEQHDVDSILAAYANVIEVVKAIGKNPGETVSAMTPEAVAAVNKIVKHRKRAAANVRDQDGNAPSADEVFDGLGQIIEEATNTDRAGLRQMVAEQTGGKEPPRPLYLKVRLAQGPYGQIVLAPEPDQFWVYDEIDGLVDGSRFLKLSLNGEGISETQALTAMRGQHDPVQIVVVSDPDEDHDEFDETDWDALAALG